MKKVCKFIFLLFVLLAGYHADLYTKQMARNSLKEKSSVTVIEGFLEFSYTENRGMVFGLMNKKESRFLHYILTGIMFISILYAMFIIWRIRQLSVLYHLPIFIILSGAMGNFIDRIRYGRVIDFIHIHWRGTLDWPYLFNVADALICIGGVLLLALILLKKDKLERAVVHRMSTKD